MAKNKKVIKEQKKYQNLQERYEEMNDYLLDLIEEQLYMSTENSVNRSLKTRSLLTKFGTCNITATGAVTI